jgi:TatA/E family protein of Tat protein translocase
MASCAVLKGGAIGSLALSQYSPLEGLQQKTSPSRIGLLRLARSGRHACSASRIGAHRQQLLGHSGAFAGRQNGPRRGLTVCGIFGLGVPELVVIAGVAAVLFGPKQLPELGKSLGKTVKSFQQVCGLWFQQSLRQNLMKLR